MSNWTIFSNHGHVLVCLARDSEARLRDVATSVGMTERAVQKIVRDLQACGMISVSKHGRRNRYRIDHKKPLRHHLEAHCTLGALVDLIAKESPVSVSSKVSQPVPDRIIPGREAPIVKRAVPVAVRPVEHSKFQPAAIKPTLLDKVVHENAAENSLVKKKPKTTKPVKPDSKTRTEHQQGTLF